MTEKRGYSILGIIYTFSVWGATFEGGTFSESFALPILFIGVYLFTKKILKNEKTSNIEIIIWGILVGIISLLRLNMLSIFLGFFVIIGINLVIKKEFKEIFRWIGFGILGFCITIMPIVIYLIKSNALIDCLNSAYFNIMSGFNSGTVEHKIRNLINMFLEFNESQAFILILSFTITSMVLIIAKKITKKEYKLYIYGIILTIIINSYANSIAGAHQMHYMLTFIPILAMCIALSIKVFDKIQLLYLHKLIVVVVIGGYLSYLGYNQYIHTCKIRKNVDYQSTIAGFMEQSVKYVASPDECIQIIGGRAEATGTNYRAQRLAASKYSYLPLWTSFTKERKQEMTSKLIEDIKNNRPKIIMICKYGEYLMEFNESIIDKEDWQNFINDNYIEQDILPKYYIVYVKKP